MGNSPDSRNGGSIDATGIARAFRNTLMRERKPNLPSQCIRVLLQAECLLMAESGHSPRRLTTHPSAGTDDLPPLNNPAVVRGFVCPPIWAVALLHCSA